MNKRRFLPLGACNFLIGFSACNFLFGNKASIPPSDVVPDGPVLITGQFDYTNDFMVEIYYVEHAIGLLGLTRFVMRDQEWGLPMDGQVLGYMDLDAENNSATFRLALHVSPAAVFCGSKTGALAGKFVY